jgi:GxxExxY protein
MAIHALSSLPEETEVLLGRIIGAGLTVHRTLGPGFLESVYCRALAIELDVLGIPYERERLTTVQYRGREVGFGKVDFVVADEAVLEVKSVARLDPVFQAKLISYLKATGLRAGLLMNFNTAMLRDGIKRVVL